MKLSYLLLFIILLLPIVNACQFSLDKYAVEVVLNKNNNYDLSKLSFAKNVLIKKDQLIFQSIYSKDLAVVMTRDKEYSPSMSLRLQIPAELKKDTTNYFIMLSTLQGKKVFNESVFYYDGWLAKSDSTSWNIQKENIIISVTNLEKSYEILLEIDNLADDCKDCDGKCISTNSGSVCISNKNKQEIINILTKMQLIDNFENLFSSYKIIGKGEKTITTLVPVETQDIDVKKAMKQELNWLIEKRVIKLDSNDVEDITKLAEFRKSGHNSRIIYDKSKNTWIYYYETENPTFTSDINCQEFSPYDVPKLLPTFTTIGLSSYYLFPIILILSMLIFIAILVIIGRIYYKLSSRKR